MEFPLWVSKLKDGSSFPKCLFGWRSSEHVLRHLLFVRGKFISCILAAKHDTSKMLCTSGQIWDTYVCKRVFYLWILPHRGQLCSSLVSPSDWKTYIWNEIGSTDRDRHMVGKGGKHEMQEEKTRRRRMGVREQSYSFVPNLRFRFSWWQLDGFLRNSQIPGLSVTTLVLARAQYYACFTPLSSANSGERIKMGHCFSYQLLRSRKDQAIHSECDQMRVSEWMFLYICICCESQVYNLLKCLCQDSLKVSLAAFSYPVL